MQEETKKLLFPTDFSALSVRALREALHLNEYLNFEITLFHAYSRPVTRKTGKGPLTAQARKITEKFGKLLEEVPGLQAHTYSFKKALGYSTDMILAEVEASRVDLIVMGTKGTVGVGELFGTKTHEIIEKLHIPIIVVPAHGGLSNIQRIGLACDFSKHSDFKKLDFLIELAEKLQAEVDIITLNRDEKSMTSTEQSNQAHVLSRMKKIPAQVRHIKHDSVEHGLKEYCKGNNIGLLGILPKNYNFIEGLFHESLTRRMAFQSPVSLLILK